MRPPVLAPVLGLFGLFILGCCVPDDWVARLKGGAEAEPPGLDDRIAALMTPEQVCGEAAPFPAWCAASKLPSAGWSAPEVDQRFLGLAVRLPAGEDLATALGRDPQLVALAIGPNTAGFSLLSASGPRGARQHARVREDLSGLLVGKGGPDLRVPPGVESLISGASAAAGALTALPDGGGTFSSGGAWRIWRVTDQPYGEAIVIAGETDGGLELAIFPLVALIPVEEADGGPAEGGPGAGELGDGPMAPGGAAAGGASSQKARAVEDDGGSGGASGATSEGKAGKAGKAGKTGKAGKAGKAGKVKGQ